MIIKIKNLRMKATVGVYEWEQLSPREVVVNLALELDGTEAALSDRLEDTADYEALCIKIASHVKANSFHLIETLAASILKLVMQEPRVQKAFIELDKPGAVKLCESVAVSATAERSGKEVLIV